MNLQIPQACEVTQVLWQLSRKSIGRNNTTFSGKKESLYYQDTTTADPQGVGSLAQELSLLPRSYVQVPFCDVHEPCVDRVYPGGLVLQIKYKGKVIKRKEKLQNKARLIEYLLFTSRFKIFCNLWFQFCNKSQLMAFPKGFFQSPFMKEDTF